MLIVLLTDDDNDLTARKAFESVLRVSLLQPTSPKFHNFSEIVRRKAANTYNYHFVEGEEVSDVFHKNRLVKVGHEVLTMLFDFSR